MILAAAKHDVIPVMLVDPRDEELPDVGLATFEDLEEEVETLAIPHRLRDFADKALVLWQAFRAGIEGTISCLKRAFRLSRCFFKGFKGFARGVGLQVFTHNLMILADLDGG